MIGMWSPAFPMAFLTSSTALLFWTNEAKTMSTPCSTPNFRSLLSFSGKSNSFPQRVTLFFEPILPLLWTSGWDERKKRQKCGNQKKKMIRDIKLKPAWFRWHPKVWLHIVLTSYEVTGVFWSNFQWCGFITNVDYILNKASISYFLVININGAFIPTILESFITGDN